MKSKQRKFLSRHLSEYQSDRRGTARNTIIEDWFAAKESQAAEQGSHVNTEMGDEIFSQITAKISNPVQKQHSANVRWAIAASIVFLLAFCTFLILKNRSLVNSAPEMVYDSYTTGNGEMKKIMLPDGTAIYLNAATTVRVPRNFKSAAFRRVMLDGGEAFFEVKRDTLRPFSIATGTYLTTVLGTSFNINAYPERSGYQVAVRTGKVRVEKIVGKQILLLAEKLVKNQVLSDREGAQEPQLTNEPTGKFADWRTDHSSYLDQMDLVQIGELLSRQYNINVEVKAKGISLPKYSFSLKYSSLPQALAFLAIKTGMDYQLTDHSLIINPAK